MSKRPLKWLAVLMLVGLMAGACSNGSSGKAKTTPPDDAGALFPKDELNQPQRTGTPKTGGTIKFGMESAVLSYSPNGNVIQPSDLQVVTSVFDALVSFGETGKFKNLPVTSEPASKTAQQLAATVTSSDSFKTWTVTLKPGIKFSNGVALDAGQVDNHTQWIKGNPACSCATDAKNIESTEMPDGPEGLTFVYHLAAANVAWPTKLTGPLGWITESGARGAAKNPVAPDTDNLIGTGPFQFQSKNNDVFTVVRNQDYYYKDPHNNGAKLPYVDSIVFTPRADATTRLSAVQSGASNIVQTADTSNIVAAKKDKQLVVQPISGSSSTILVLNLTKAPFGVVPDGTSEGATAKAAKDALSNKNANTAREAFATAINRQEINQKYYSGSRVPAYGFIPDDNPYFDKDGQLPRYDKAKATKLIAEYTKAAGSKPVINAICIPTPESDAIFAILQQQGKAVGIKANMKSVEQAVLVQTLLLGQSTTATANWNVACFRAPQISDPDDVYGALHTGGATNLVNYQNPKVDAALDKGRTVEGIDKRKPYYDTVQVEVAKDMAYIPLLFDYFGNITQDSISGLGTPRPDNLGLISLAGIYFKK